MIALFLAIIKSHGIENTLDYQFFLVEKPDVLQNQIDTLEAKLARLLAVQNGVIIQPIRQGFPYCEPFTGNILERINTQVGGSAILTAAAGQNNGVLQLTNLTADQLGYAFIDLPFSSTYGIKVSFEYFIYNPSNPGNPGDGISFFLYDGNISAADFRIGGLGGSLGYAPHGNSGGGFTGNPISGQGFGGLFGGYLGIGFDVFGNFGNEYQRKFGGFLRPNDYWATHIPVTQPRYPNSVVVRGPQIIQPGEERRNGMPTTYPFTGIYSPPYPSYRFITGKVTYDDGSLNPNITKGTGSLPKTSQYFVSPQFRLGSSGRVDNCNQEGYRKVFIDFKPVDPNNPSAGYLIDVDMLVNNGTATPELVQVLNTAFNPSQQVPPTFKLGFAGATGSQQAFQEIRNVTVQVSNENQLTKPVTNDLNASACIGQEEFFELDVNLQNINSEIQCVQLYETEAEALAVQNQLNQITNLQDCNSGICQIEVCKQERLLEETTLGFFEAAIFLENGKEVPKIKFKSKGNAFGTTTIWYTVTDNFGQISAPKKITIVINPFPKIDSSGSIIGPTCNGQNDGKISNVIIKDLIPGFTYFWRDPSGNTIPSSNYTLSQTTIGGYIQATIGLNNINLGKYTLVVNNPSTNGACDDTFQFEVKDVRGTPVDVVLDDQEICQGTPVIFTPQLEDLTDAPNPKFIWWKDINKTQGSQITNGLTEGSVKYEITGPGNLTITGLTQSATPYEYFLEVQADDSQNICATPAGNLKRVQVLVLAPLNITAAVTDDLCRQSTGQIVVTATGGFPTKTYSLNGGPFQSSNTFSNLLPGTYTIEVNAGTNCLGTITRTINGPANALSISYLDQVNPSCGLNNGVVRFQVAGGTPNYTFTLNGSPVTPTLSGGIYSISGLSPGSNYTVEVRDINSCPAAFTSPTLNAIPIPGFGATDDVICPGETAVLSPTVIELSNATNLTYTWKDKAGNNLVNGGGVTYTVNGTTGELSITGLQENANPYEYTLVVSGTNICNNTPIPAKVTVNPTPKLNPSTIVNVNCFGENTGSITLNPADPSLASNFQYSIDGGSTFQSSPVFTNLGAKSYDFLIRNTVTGCSTSLNSVVITQPSELILTLDKFIQPACGVPNGQLEVSISGGTPGYKLELLLNGTVLQTSNTPTAKTVYSDLAPGTYQVRLTDNLSCQKIVNQVLINDVGIPITVSPMSDEICFGDIAKISPSVTTAGSAVLKWYKDAAATQEIVTNTTPDADGLVFTINSATKELSVAGLKAGSYSYYLVAAGPGYCPNPPFEANIKVLEPITATTFVTDEICFGAKDGTITVTAVGADGNFEYSINNGPFVSGNVFNGVAPGTHAIAIRSKGDNGCSYQTSATVKGPSSAIAVNTPNIFRNSCDQPNGSIENLVISGGWGNYKVEWRKGSLTGPVIAGDQTGAKNLLNDTYYLLVEDAEGCQVSFNFLVNEMPDPVFVIAPQEICAGQSVVLTPVNTVSGSAPTDLVWYKDAGKTQPISSGPDSANPAITYSIEPITSKLTINGLSGANLPYSYYLNVVCTNAMVKVDAVVRVVPNPVFETERITCFGGNDGKIKVQSGGDSKYRYSVDGGSPLTQAQLEALSFAAKTYTISVTNEGFCITNFPVEVKQPSVALKTDPLQKIDPGCGQDVGIIRTKVTGGWSPYSVTLSRGGTAVQTSSFNGPSVEFTNLSPGTYSLEVTDGEGCKVTSNTITMLYGPTSLDVLDVTICEGEDVVFKPTAVPVASGATFEWFKNSALTIPIVSSSVPDANGHVFNIAADGTLTAKGLKSSNSPVTYFVRIVGGTSCPGFVADARAMINKLPSLASSIKDEVCFGEKGQIVLTGTSGDGVFTYSLDGINFQTDGNFQVTPGTYTGYVRSGAGCIVSLLGLEVKGPNSSLIVSAPSKQDASCNTPDGSVTFNVSGGYSTTFTVNTLRNGVLLKSEVVSPGQVVVSNLPSGTYSFTVTDSGGCSVSLPGNIAIEDIDTPLTANDAVICEGETAVLIPYTTQAGISPIYTWYTNPNGSGQIIPGTSNGVTYQIDPSGTLRISGLAGRPTPYLYYVKISGPGVCEPPIFQVKVQVFEIPNLRVSNPSIVCDPTQTVDLTEFIEGFDPSIYDYQVLNPNGSLMRIDEIEKVNRSGNYQVRSSLKGANCWSPNQRIRVDIAEEELVPDFIYQADLGGGNFLENAEAQILEKVNFLDISLGKVIIWNWNFGDGNSSAEKNPVHVYDKKGTYTIKLTTIDEIGCIAVTEKLITVLDDYVIMIPNAFTPVGQKNQYFKPQFRGLASMEFYVFSTWGELIFEAKTLETSGWDGTLNGKDAPNGNYVYRAIFQTRSGESVQRSGVFTLIR